MNAKLFDALEDCLAALEQGAELNDVLARHPDLEADLRPVLEAAEKALEAAGFSVPSEAIQQSRTRLLGHAAQLRGKRPTKRWFGLPRAAVVALTAGFVILISTGGLLTASAQSLPGDTLYSMKRAVEKVSLTLTSGEKAKRSLQDEYNQRRIEETMALLKLGRSEMVTYEGVVNEKTADFWVVDDIRTLVMPNTNIVGQIDVGMGVEVTGEVQPGDWVEATTIRLRIYRFSGTVESIGDDEWLISGRKVRLDDLTLVDNDVRVGDLVMVLVAVDDLGDLTALSILQEEDLSTDSTPEPSPAEEDGDEHEGDDDHEGDDEHNGDGEEVKLEGILESIESAIWSVGGESFQITSNTEIDENIEVGDTVKVKAFDPGDGTLIALKIERVDDDDNKEDKEKGEEVDPTHTEDHDHPDVTDGPDETGTPEPEETPDD